MVTRLSVFRGVDGECQDEVLLRKGAETLATIPSHGLGGHVAAVAESTKAAEASQLLNRDQSSRQPVCKLYDPVQHTAMSSSRRRQESNQDITPPSSFADLPLTPPPTDEKPFAQAPRVIALFHEIQTRKHSDRGPWIEFQLAEGDYDKIAHLLSQDEELLGFVEDKIR